MSPRTDWSSDRPRPQSTYYSRPVPTYIYIYPKVKDYSGGLKIGTVIKMKKPIAAVLKSLK